MCGTVFIKPNVSRRHIQMDYLSAVYMTQCAAQLPSILENLIKGELFVHLPNTATAVLQIASRRVLENHKLKSVRGGSVVQTDEMRVWAGLS